MNRLRSALDNPVLRRELIERWRGRRAFVVITVYVGLLAGLMRLLWWMGNSILEDRLRWGGFETIAAGPALGRFLFENLLGLVLLLVLFIAPGYAAAQISGERERQTLGLLQITLVRPWQIVAGKLGSSIAWLLLLVVVSLPFAATAFLMGGVSLADLVRAYAMVLLLAVSIAGIGVGISSLTRRTTAAVVLTYAAVMALVVGTLFASAVELMVRRNDIGPQRPLALYANPYFGLADAARADRFRFFGGGELPSMLTPFAHALPERDVVFEEHAVMMEAEAVAVPDGVAMPAVPEPVPFDEPRPMPMPVPIDQPGVREESRDPVWLITLGVHLALGAGGFAIATSRVRPENTPLRRRRDKDQGEVDGGARIERDPLPSDPVPPVQPEDVPTRPTS